MFRFLRLISATLCAFALADVARAEDPPAAIAEDAVPLAKSDEPAAIAEGYFDETERFDAFLTYEVRRGPARALFTIARRWRDGLAELLFDIREPASFDKWAMLMRQTRGGSDDFFLYAGYATDGKVRRLASSQIQRQAVFELLAPGDYRPTPRGELSYEAGPNETLDTVPCRVVIARAQYLGYDRLELVFSADTNQLLQSRFIRREKEVRRLTTTLADYKDFGGRRLPIHRIARRWGDDGETEIVLQRLVEVPDLPDALFSHLNLRIQHFPEF